MTDDQRNLSALPLDWPADLFPKRYGYTLYAAAGAALYAPRRSQ